MPATTPETNAAEAPPLRDEADIGSGERTPGQQETDELIKQIPPLPPTGGGAGQPGGNAANQTGGGTNQADGAGNHPDGAANVSGGAGGNQASQSS